MDTVQISEIITQVINRMIAAHSNIPGRSKALVIFEDLRNGLSIPEEIKQSSEGYNLSLLTFENAEGMVIPEGLERVFTIRDLSSNHNEWIKQFERVLIPYPSLKAISRIAHVILDDKFTEIIFSALQEGKQVLMGQDSEDCKLQKLAAPLRTEIQRLNGKLKDYGIGRLPSSSEEKKCPPTAKNIECKTRGVLSLQDVVRMAGNSNELSIGAGMVITPLAMDYIRDKKIFLNRKG